MFGPTSDTCPHLLKATPECVARYQSDYSIEGPAGFYFATDKGNQLAKDPAMLRLQQASGYTLDPLSVLVAMSAESRNVPHTADEDTKLFHASSAGASL